MIKLNTSALLGMAFLALVSCKNETKKTDTQETTQEAVTTTLSVTGNYVSSEYEKRDEGYDWVSVAVKAAKDEQLKIAVRSRADKKKPTCTFEALAKKVNDSTFTATAEGKTILFSFKDNQISITTQNESDSNILNFYCSGGGSLAGSYQKIEGDLDQTQIDKTIFRKNVTLQGISFSISTQKNGMETELTVTPYGLEIDNSAVTQTIDGSVVDAEIEDLNSDGSPEVLMYTKSDGSGSYGNVIGFSVNNKKSMSQIYFPPITDNKELSKGYMGHDEFTIIETTLSQRFPIYKEGDSNANPTGGTRQITYKLFDGEASRKFVVKNSTEFNTNN
ncbi:MULTISPECIES: PliI family lysozyme inhibitor of I-type lysozyme [unclassified Tenacibaculum]|uniref:PliI family lysozyme inhibitor of I-type lysozyme n=1 Tax=unclassified Tenacibaculum TaxID=2635139 RepID=UPI00237B61C5|nr:PliI family lysozyme inhibitor of I-type lysozyme [Tenacibaculum sp. L6]MDE0534997.1 PliI family lysozyme inhibitor of I-type lysozyme [Tenacibaculum sp. L6]